MANDNPIRLSRNEICVLQMLIASAGKELHAYGMADDSNGLLKRTGIYTLLTRMELEKGLVESRKEAVRKGAKGNPRRLYKVTGVGREALHDLETQQAGFNAMWGRDE